MIIRSTRRGNFPIVIGYHSLRDLVIGLDTKRSVYVVSQIETMTKSAQNQRIDQHYIMVTQPDANNQVHYCRIAVVQLVYHNGIAFAPDYVEQLAQVEQKRGEVVVWLAGQGYQVEAGLVGIPKGIMTITGKFVP